MGLVMAQTERDSTMALNIVDKLERQTAKKTIEVARGAFGLNYVTLPRRSTSIGARCFDTAIC